MVPLVGILIYEPVLPKGLTCSYKCSLDGALTHESQLRHCSPCTVLLELLQRLLLTRQTSQPTVLPLPILQAAPGPAKDPTPVPLGLPAHGSHHTFSPHPNQHTHQPPIPQSANADQFLMLLLFPGTRLMFLVCLFTSAVCIEFV